MKTLFEETKIEIQFVEKKQSISINHLEKNNPSCGKK